MSGFKKIFKLCLFSLSLILTQEFMQANSALAFDDAKIEALQKATAHLPLNEKIAFWANHFVGTPYDPDPLGEYVRKAVIVADKRVDCMYLTFRAVELAMSSNPKDAIEIALNLRFHTRGILKDGKVLNYEDRFEYGEDMILSGKWGRDITSEIGQTVSISGSRNLPVLEYLPPKEILANSSKLQTGDIMFLVFPMHKRFRDALIGHIGIITKEGSKTYLIHASGLKNKGGKVKKVPLSQYLKQMPFIGALFTRFDLSSVKHS